MTGSDRMDGILQQMSVCSILMRTLKWMTPFNCCLLTPWKWTQKKNETRAQSPRNLWTNERKCDYHQQPRWSVLRQSHHDSQSQSRPTPKADEYHRQHRIIEQVHNGSKLMQVTHDRIQFIDSLSFFQMPFSAFPKTFGIKELKKGYFPHLFNTLDNQDYQGPFPDKQYYMVETMSVSGHKDFELVRQSQIVQSVMQDYQYDLHHLLPVCNLLVQGPKITYNYCLSRRSGLLWWFTLNFVHFKFINTSN